jgi:hypothetical protein
MAIYYRFLLRGYTAAEWAASNGILLDREIGLETDTGRTKLGIGDNAPWNDKPYVILGLGEVDLSTLADGDILQFDAANNGWTAVHLSAAIVPYDGTSSGLAATDVQTAIDEVTASAGGVPYLIASGKTYRVPTGMQALFAKTIRLADASSRLLVEGYLVEVH